MKEEKKFQEMYQRLMEYQNGIHEKNQKRIKIGIWCLFIIPVVFLFLVFVTGSSKIIFLVLWIISLFAIAVYLVGIEYYDYTLQEKMSEISGKKDTAVEGLIDINQLEDKISEVAEKIESRGGVF